MYNTGSTLQLKKANDISCNAQLLIVTDDSAYIEKIEQILKTIPLSFTYHVVSCSLSIQALSKRKYDLILYKYSHSKNYSCNSNEPYPIKELSWWYNLPSKIPLILITEPLGDEMAVACIQSGISDYILTENLSKLPYILEKNLINYISKNTDKLQQLLNEISHLKQELKKLQEKNVELITANKNNINQEYFSHLNHELRSPLANILQFARMLKEEIYGSLNQKQTEYISGILTSGDHLSELINDYLDIAKIDANHEELYKEKILVEDICKASLVMIQGKAKKKEIDLILDIAQDVDFCFVDSLRLKQILINLLSNAVKFTEKGYIRLQVKTTPQEMLFSVVDTGMGINEENFNKLFEPFQQIKNPVHRKDKGTGLGLALSRKLAQLHGGDITVISKEGKGSCFTVSLPRYNTEKK